MLNFIGRLTIVQYIQDYTSLILGDTLYIYIDTYLTKLFIQIGRPCYSWSIGFCMIHVQVLQVTNTLIKFRSIFQNTFLQNT